MQHSDSLASLAAALSKAQAELKPAVKDKTNPHLKSKYADLGSVWDACREALAQNGLSVVQLPVTDEPGYIALETMLLHASGEYISARARTRLQKDDAQGVGSGLTYLRRYSLSAALGIVADEDDDGHAASQPARQQQAPRAQAQQARPAAVQATQAADHGAVVAINRKLEEELEFGASERDQKLSFIGWLAGRAIKSSKDLTPAEAERVLTVLNALPDQDARQNLVQNWVDAQGAA